MGEENDGALEARAAENAKTLPGWSTEKQRRYEQLLQDERLEYDRCRAKLAANDLPQLEPLVITPSSERRSGEDPWIGILGAVEGMPGVNGCLERVDGFVRVRSKFLFDEVLGLNPEEITQRDRDRLSLVMSRLGWVKPRAIRFGTTVVNGYKKPME